MPTRKIEPGSHPAATGFSITVSEKGPYLVYGRPPLAAQFIMPDAEHESWYFQEGRRFSTEAEPTALCRCGASKRKPYCDGTHARTAWDPSLTAPDEALLDQAFRDLERAELLLVLGSSLTVQPAAGLPLATRAGGGKIVIVNAQPTPLDRYAALRYDDLGSVFGELERWLENPAD